MRRLLVTPVRLVSVVALLGLLAVACSPSEDEIGAAWGLTSLTGDTADAGDVERFALLVAAVQHPRARGALRTDPVHLRAAFVAHEGQPREAVLDLLSLPPVLRLQPVDTCVRVTSDASLPSGGDAFRPDGGAGWVDLLDAGRVSARVAASRRPLDTQYFPDVVPTVSGVTYAGSTGLGQLALRRRALPDVTFESSGSDEVGPFAVSVSLPAPVRIRLVAGRSPLGGIARARVDGDLSVRWDARGASEEPLLVELSRRSFADVDTIRCVVEDDGSFVVPAAVRAQLPAHPEPATDRLTIRRVTGAEFYARGLDEGWAFATSEDFVLLELSE